MSKGKLSSTTVKSVDPDQTGYTLFIEPSPRWQYYVSCWQSFLTSCLRHHKRPRLDKSDIVAVQVEGHQAIPEWKFSFLECLKEVVLQADVDLFIAGVGCTQMIRKRVSVPMAESKPYASLGISMHAYFEGACVDRQYFLCVRSLKT